MSTRIIEVFGADPVAAPGPRRDNPARPTAVPVRAVVAEPIEPSPEPAPVTVAADPIPASILRRAAGALGQTE